MNTVNDMITNASKKEVTVKKDDVVIRHPGSGQARSKARPIEIDTTRDVWRSTVLTLFKHVADMHLTIVNIIADKYDLDPNKIVDVISDDPRWTELQVHPIIHDLIGDDGRVEIPDAKVVEKPKRGRPPKKVATPAPVAAPVAAPAAAEAPKAEKPKTVRRKPIKISTEEPIVIE